MPFFRWTTCVLLQKDTPVQLESRLLSLVPNGQISLGSQIFGLHCNKRRSETNGESLHKSLHSCILISSTRIRHPQKVSQLNSFMYLPRSPETQKCRERKKTRNGCDTYRKAKFANKMNGCGHSDSVAIASKRYHITQIH